MAKGRKTGGRNFQPGHSGNPGGRAKAPEELRHIKTLSSEEVKKVFSKYFRSYEQELVAVIESPEEIMLDKIIAKGLLEAAKGNLAWLNLGFDRTIGKVVEKTEIELPEPIIIRRRTGDELLLGAEKKAIE